MAKRINLVVLWFYDYDGSKIFNSGLQRWCRDAALLLQRKGYEVTVYQKATKDFEVEMAPRIRVVGVKCSLSFGGNYTLSRWLDRNCSAEEPFVFVSKEMCWSKKIRRAVGVDHGIWWDGDYPRWRKWLNRQLQYRFVRRLGGIICVDTNFINWCHAELHNRTDWQQKLTYIPNYADEEHFKPLRKAPGASSGNGPLTVLFPRACGSKLDGHIRGAGLLTKAIEVLERRGVRTRVLFVGEGDLRDEVYSWAVGQGVADRVKVFSVAMDEMPSVYERADVVVVPTVAREGTSLAAVESLVSGMPTVVSHIGGLGNIVVPGLNGYMCDLTPESLADAILEARGHNPLHNPAVLDACRGSLGKERWEHRVWSYLERTLKLS